MVLIKVAQEVDVLVQEDTRDHIENDTLYFYTDRIKPDDDGYDPPKDLNDDIDWMLNHALDGIDLHWRERYYDPWDGDYSDINDLNINDVYIVPRARADSGVPFTMGELLRYEKSLIIHDIDKRQ